MPRSLSANNATRVFSDVDQCENARQPVPADHRRVTFPPALASLPRQLSGGECPSFVND
jgi:hypothetical protein